MIRALLATAVVAASATAPMELNLNDTSVAAPPSTALHVVQADGQLGRVDVDVFGDVQGVLMCRKARGTAASPTPVLANDYMCTTQAWGFDGTSYGSHPAASSAFRSAADWTSSSHPTWWKIEVTKRGATDNILGLYVTPEGHLGSLAGTPTLSCGAGSIRGDDNAGRVTVGDTACVVRFSSEWRFTDGPGKPGVSTVPACVASDETSPVLVRAQPTSTQMTLVGALPGDRVVYQCRQIGNG